MYTFDRKSELCQIDWCKIVVKSSIHTVYRNFFASGNFCENDSLEVC